MAFLPDPMLKTFWKGILALAKLIGHVQTWLILTVFYFVILAPVALIFKCIADPLRLRGGSGSLWTPRILPDDWRIWATEQF